MNDDEMLTILALVVCGIMAGSALFMMWMSKKGLKEKTQAELE